MTSWLDRYGNRQHEWQRVNVDKGRIVFERRLGLIENSFDADGLYHGGRADLTHCFDFELRTSLGREELLERIALAWTVLRLHHVLMLAKAEDRTRSEVQRFFVVDVARDGPTALRDGKQNVTVLDSGTPIDPFEFRTHSLNTARIIDPLRSLSTLFVLSIQQLGSDRYKVSFMIVLAHMITDGLSLFHWLGHFVDLLNKPVSELQSLLTKSLDPSVIASRLPPAQEDLYPSIPGSKARQRWFWAIVRVLRHVRKPAQAGFTNPLRRPTRTTLAFQPKFSQVLNYSTENAPPMNSGSCTPSLSLEASRRLAALCREAGTSVGAGVFALVGVVMMDMEELLHSDVLPEDRPPFVASFPLNPRPFFNYTGPHDSCMLAFSEGIAMPFLPSSLPLEGRIRLLARAAHRALKTYQKRKKLTTDAHTPLRMLATNYLVAVERADKMLPEKYRSGFSPQGAYPAQVGSLATCGVSSVGLVKDCAPGKFDLNIPLSGPRDVIADFRELRGGVRARDNEFLCGNSADEQGRLSYSVSFDASAMDLGKVEEWKRRIENVLEPGDRVSRL
jgi:hypothetical protein